MGVVELVVAICIAAILAAVAIPFYITFMQQARVILIIIPRLQLIEANISLFYYEHNELPGSPDTEKILAGIDLQDMDIVLTNGSIALTVKARDRDSQLHVLDGKVLIASPVLTRDKIIAWHLSGALADRLKINY